MQPKAVKYNNQEYKQKPKVYSDGSFRGSSRGVDKELKTKLTHERKMYIRENMDKSIEELKQETDLAGPIIKMVILADKQNLSRREGRWKRRAPKFDRTSQEMRDWLVKKTEHKDKSGETWGEIYKEFNKKYTDSDITPVSKWSIREWAKKLTKKKSLLKG